jgi:uncharacterized protein (TIGR02466 family)
MNEIIHVPFVPIKIVDLSPLVDCSHLLSTVEQLNFLDPPGRLSRSQSRRLHLDLKFKPIVDVVQQEVKKYICQCFDFHLFERVAVKSMWAVRSYQGNVFEEHTHSMSVVSGSIFVSDTPDNTNLSFSGPEFKLPVTGKKFYDRCLLSKHVSTTLQYHMVLFPSNLSHSVNAVGEDRIRYTLAFDTFWEGMIGTGTSSMNINLVQ